MSAELKSRIGSDRTPLQKVIPLSTPYLVFLDPSNACNSKCAWCATGSGEAIKHRPEIIMNFNLYKKIINDLASMPDPIKTLRLYAFGEPFLNNNFCRMVRYAKDTGRFGQIDCTTNGKLLSPMIAGKLINSGLDKIFISIPDRYTVRYQAQIAYLYYMSRASTMKIHAKFIGKQSDLENKHPWLYSCSDYVSNECQINCWPNFNAGPDPETSIYGTPITDVLVCPYPFYSLTINSNGTVSACFLDWPNQMLLGDLNNQTFWSIWNGKRLREFQIMQLSGDRNNHFFCKNCHQLTHGSPDNLDTFAYKILEKMS